MKTILFKRDANNNVLEWIIWVEEHIHPILHIVHGQSGAQKTHHTYNHTSLEAANLDMSRRITKQLARRGYSKTIPHQRPIKPMLAYVYAAHAHKLPEQVYIQPKLNGLRCLASHKYLKSRSETYFNLPHIQKLLSHLPEDIILDGELYLHTTNLQTIISYTRNHVPPPEAQLVQYHVYDIVEESLCFSERYKLLQELFSSSLTEQEPTFYNKQRLPAPIKLVDTLLVPLSEVNEHYHFFLTNKYEGAMIRDPLGLYRTGARSDKLLKLKPIQESTAKIIEILPMEKKPHLGKLVLQTATCTFKCSIKGTDEYRRQLLSNRKKYIGKICTFEFEDYSDDNIPLKPVCTKIL